jgi:hypothetical protein
MGCRCRLRGAYPGSKRRPISGLGPPSSPKSGLRPFASDGGWFTTFLTSTPGSMSIRVEGGP